MGGCGAACAHATGGISRRQALRLIGVTAAAPALAGCDQVASLLVPEGVLEEMGRETWARLVQRMPPSRDPAAHALADRVSLRLLEAADERPADWEVRVFADPGVNAFVLPGRRIGILEGMIRVSRGEGGLAAVVGHEIGHLEANHAQERAAVDVARHVALQMISFLLQVNEVAFANEIAAALGVGAEFGLVRPYGRAQELEADRLGVFMMARAGYDPIDAAELWTRMDVISQGGPPAILSTHPAPRARIDAILDTIPAARAAAAIR